MTENINLSNESENQENTIPSVENKEKKALEPKVVSEGDFGRADRTFQRVLTLD